MSAYRSIMGEAFDRALRRLSQIVDELTRVPVDDFPARDALMRERDTLRNELADLRGQTDPDTARSTDDLARELKALESSAADLKRQRIDAVVQAGGGSPGGGQMGNLGVTALNARLTEATGLAAMERRIDRLRSIIEDRASE